jgi:hypothetical protein
LLQNVIGTRTIFSQDEQETNGEQMKWMNLSELSDKNDMVSMYLGKNEGVFDKNSLEAFSNLEE